MTESSHMKGDNCGNLNDTFAFIILRDDDGICRSYCTFASYTLALLKLFAPHSLVVVDKLVKNAHKALRQEMW